MKNFNEVFENIEARNKEKRLALIQTMQPFFNAMQQKAAYDEEYQRTLEAEEQRNIRVGTAFQKFRETGVVDLDAPPELQTMALNDERAKKQRVVELQNTIEQLGYGDTWSKMMAENPNADPDVIYGQVAKAMKVEAKEIDREDFMWKLNAQASKEIQVAAAKASISEGGSGSGSKKSKDGVDNGTQESTQQDVDTAKAYVKRLGNGTTLDIGGKKMVVQVRQETDSKRRVVLHTDENGKKYRYYPDEGLLQINGKKADNAAAKSMANLLNVANAEYNTAYQVQTDAESRLNRLFPVGDYSDLGTPLE